LTKALTDPEPKVRRDAARALGELGKAAGPALAAVRAAKADPDPEVKAAAERAERLIDPAAATGNPGRQ
jgi:HEAT repeat protein